MHVRSPLASRSVAIGLGLAAIHASCLAPLQAQEARRSSPNSNFSLSLWDAILEEGKSVKRSKVMDYLDHLTNRIGPRLTSSQNLQKACEWARDELRAMGYQNARLEKWGEFPVGFDRGPWSGRVTSPDSMRGELIMNTMAWSAGTQGPLEGQAVLSPTTLDEAQERRDELRGKWLLRDKNLGRTGGRTFNKLRDLLKDYGALGFVYPGLKTRSGKFDKKIVHKNLLMTGGNYRIKWNKLPSFPRIQVRYDQFQKLFAAVEDGQEVKLRFDVRNWFRKGPIPLYNVIAELEGHEKPDEFVVVGGHIDSWDGATGTTDNGTGSSTTLEAARILAAVGAKPRRTIRFMLWSGEEQGLMGSRAWAQRNRKIVRENCQAALVHDGGTNYAGGILGSSAQMPVLRSAFAGFETIDPDFPFAVQEGKQPSYGSDHVSFIMLRAPGFYWQQKGTALYNYGHHTQHDTFDLAVPEYQRQTATIAALGALALANIEERMPAPVGRTRNRRRPAIPSHGLTVDSAMLVTMVDKTGMLVKAGVRAGDILLTFDGKKIEGGRSALRSAFVDFVRKGKESAEVVVKRGSKRIALVLRAAGEASKKK